MVLLGYFLGTKVFLHRHWIIRSPFDCCIICNDNTFNPEEKRKKKQNNQFWKLLLLEEKGKSIKPGNKKYIFIIDFIIVLLQRHLYNFNKKHMTKR